MPQPLTIADVRSAFRVADMAVKAVALQMYNEPGAVHYVEPDHDGDVFLGDDRLGGLYPIPGPKGMDVWEACSHGGKTDEFVSVREATLWLIEQHIRRDMV